MVCYWWVMSELLTEHYGFRVIYSDDNFIAVNKTLPLPMLPGKNSKTSLQDLVCNFEAGIRKKPSEESNEITCKGSQNIQYNSASKIITNTAFFLEAPHRIDERTSGIALFCKTRESLIITNYLFQLSLVQKKYYALVETARAPQGDSGIVRHRLYHDERANKTFAKPVNSSERRNNAELAWRVHAVCDDFTLLEIEPRQGKTHQIRAQLAAIGSPIIGDIKYGSHYKTTSGFIMLHARFMCFPSIKSDEEFTKLTTFMNKQTKLIKTITNTLLTNPITLQAPFPIGEPLWNNFNTTITDGA